MNILIVLGHPESNSFNHALAQTCKSQLITNGHTVLFHDLYNEQFNPILGQANDDDLIKTHQSDLVNSDGIIVIHPNWWGQPPAIMKGWMDRVLQYNIAYKFDTNSKGEQIACGLLKAQIAIVLNTSNTNEELENELYKDPLDTIWRNRVFKFCGVNQFDRRVFRVIKDSTFEQRSAWLTEVKTMINTHFPKA